MVIGAQNSLGFGSVPVNPGRAMPTTVYAVRLSVILLPTNEGSAANLPLHKPSLTTTTAFSPGTAQSESTRPRPWPGCSCKTSK